jgi:hypothetical protein
VIASRDLATGETLAGQMQADQLKMYAECCDLSEESEMLALRDSGWSSV